jgi:hypothetical protein
MTDRELLDALVAALRPLLDPGIAFISAWSSDKTIVDAEEIRAQIKALIAQYDGDGCDA